MAKRILSVVGGCSEKMQPTGFQFVESGNMIYLEGSYLTSGDGGEGESETHSGDFRLGQSFKARGCRLCGNKFVYQCGHCGSFVCYNGKATANAECPVCGMTSNVPATTDDRIVRSATAKPLQILMVMDVSVSMEERTSSGHTRLDDTKRSAVNNFVTKFPDAEIALVTFGGSVNTVSRFTKKHPQLIRQINGLRAEGGTTSPFKHIVDDFPEFVAKTSPKSRFMVVFTDGAWAGNAPGHIARADQFRENGISIITIGCAGADMAFLQRVASQGANIEVRNDDFGSAYATAAQKISQ